VGGTYSMIFVGGTYFMFLPLWVAPILCLILCSVTLWMAPILPILHLLHFLIWWHLFYVWVAPILCVNLVAPILCVGGTYFMWWHYFDAYFDVLEKTQTNR
jgi:hypothetical protein